MWISPLAKSKPSPFLFFSCLRTNKYYYYLDTLLAGFISEVYALLQAATFEAC